MLAFSLDFLLFDRRCYAAATRFRFDHHPSWRARGRTSSPRDRRSAAAVLDSFRRLHITLGNQEPFQGQALERVGRSQRAVTFVRYFPNGVRSRLPVLLLRLPSRLTVTATGTNDKPVFSAPAGVGGPVDITS